MIISLKNKIIFAIIPLTIIFLTIFTFTLYFSAKKKIKISNDLFVNELVKSKANEIGLTVLEIKKELIMLSEFQDIKNFATNKEELSTYLKNISYLDSNISAAIFIADAKGDTINSQHLITNIADRDYFINIMKKNSSFEMSDPIISRLINKPAFVIAVPIKDKNNKVIGILASVILTENVSKAINSIHLKNKGSAGIINKNGIVIAHQNNKYIMKRNIYDILKSQKKSFNQNNIKDSGNIFYNNNGVKTFISYSLIPNTDHWIFGISIPEKNIYKDIYTMLYLMIVLSIIITIIMSFSFYLMIKKTTEPLKKLTKTVKEFSETMTDISLEIKTNDEVEELCNAFNKMAKTIIRNTNNLESIIHTQTKELYSVNAKLLAQNSELEFLNEQLQEKNDNLYKIATQDNLTGFFNRYEMYRKLEIMILKKERNIDYQFSVLLLDLDNFKYYNDTFGHDVGDEVLKLFASFLITYLRETDIKVRYGGDEFIIITEESIEKSCIIANKIITELKKYYGFQHELSQKFNTTILIDEKKWLSCSIGIYEYHNNKRKSPEEIIKLADDALYRAKKSGKGRVEY